MGQTAKIVAAVKQWVAEVFPAVAGNGRPGPGIRCTEPGCPPLETAIGLLSVPGQPRLYKMHKALAEVTFADVLRLADEEIPKLRIAGDNNLE